MSEAAHIDALQLARELIRHPSVTPKDEGALDVLARALEGLGFACERMAFADGGKPRIENLYARLGTEAPNFCFAGHTDVVPVGDGWTVDPFKAEVIEGRLFGRGAADMKSAIAAFAGAASQYLKKNGAPRGSISLLITGDEEGEAVNGTVKVLERLKDRGEILDACVVGEPTNPTKLGQMIKIGRRGSLTGKLVVHGTQGHSAYPHLADNPIPRLMKMLAALIEKPLDEGSEHFQPSTVAITTVDVGNTATNVIPALARAGFNIRFNDKHTGEALRRWVKETFDRAAEGGSYDLQISVSGESFITMPGPLTSLVEGAVKSVLGVTPELSTTGGTSDARFIKNACPVCEFGLVGQSMHKADEHCLVSDIEALTRIYLAILEGYFK
ncbi:MAG: succinyl-diaminopimelate desuccinylase [Rhodospirillaceae bacterium]